MNEKRFYVHIHREILDAEDRVSILSSILSFRGKK